MGINTKMYTVAFFFLYTNKRILDIFFNLFVIFGTYIYTFSHCILIFMSRHYTTLWAICLTVQVNISLFEHID